jgi:hypothetical protein
VRQLDADAAGRALVAERLQALNGVALIGPFQNRPDLRLEAEALLKIDL